MLCCVVLEPSVTKVAEGSYALTDEDYTYEQVLAYPLPLPLPLLFTCILHYVNNNVKRLWLGVVFLCMLCVMYHPFDCSYLTLIRYSFVSMANRNIICIKQTRLLLYTHCYNLHVGLMYSHYDWISWSLSVLCTMLHSYAFIMRLIKYQIK